MADAAPIFTPLVWLQLRHFCDSIPKLYSRVKWHLPIMNHFVSVQTFQGVDVLGLSSFIWNDATNRRVAAKFKKINPNGWIVMGGPQVDFEDPSLFSRHPDVDLFVRGEGEVAFSKILLEILNSPTPSFDEIPGVHRHHFRNPVLFSERTPQYSSESYYQRYSDDLDRLFNESLFLKNHSQPFHRGVLTLVETDRGCPYRCKFCAWGGPQGKKLTRFDSRRARRDVLWAVRRNFSIQMINANFGFFPEDLELFRFAIRLKRHYHARSLFWNDWAKSDLHWKNIRDMAIEGERAKLIRGFKLSLQSSSEEVLKEAGRKNLSEPKRLGLIDSLKGNGVLIAAELILGLPGDRFERFLETVADTLEKGVFSFVISPYFVVPGSESFSQEYRKQKEIKTIWRQLNASMNIIEYCVASYSYTQEDYIQMNAFSWLVAALLTDGMGIALLWALRYYENIPYSVSLRTIFESAQNTKKFPALASAMRKTEIEFKKFVYGNSVSIDSYFEIPCFNEAQKSAQVSRRIRAVDFGHALTMRACFNFKAFNEDLFKAFRNVIGVGNQELFEDLCQLNFQVQDRFEDNRGKVARSQFDWLGAMKPWVLNGFKGPLPVPEKRKTKIEIHSIHDRAAWKQESLPETRLRLFLKERLGTRYIQCPSFISVLVNSTYLEKMEVCGRAESFLPIFAQ